MSVKNGTTNIFYWKLKLKKYGSTGIRNPHDILNLFLEHNITFLNFEFHGNTCTYNVSSKACPM